MILSKRQQEVLQLTSQGLCRKEIARALGLAVGTVKEHRLAAHRILGAAQYRRAVFKNAA